MNDVSLKLNDELYGFSNKEILDELYARFIDMEEYLSTVFEEVGKVYDELTNGTFSKPNTRSEYVIDRVREIYDQDLNELQEQYDDLAKENEDLHDALYGAIDFLRGLENHSHDEAQEVVDELLKVLRSRKKQGVDAIELVPVPVDAIQREEKD